MICRLHRWIVACALDSDRTLGAPTQRHLRSCPACHQYYQAQQQVSDALKLQASQVTLPANQLLSERIMASVPPQDPAVKRHARIFRLTTYRTMAACLLLVLVLMVPIMRMTPNPDRTSDLDPSALTRMATLLQQAVPGQLNATHSFLVQDPLKSEIHKLSTDAQRAVRFLVQCAPSHGSTGAGTSPD